jgi:uncharacterized membrane protein YfcA
VSLWLLAIAGVVAGAINAVVGSGTLLTYPLLIAHGLPPVIATGSNTLGMFPAGTAAAFGYRRELRGRGRTLAPYVIAISVGALIGASLVVLLPAAVFTVIVPWLILLACALVVVQPRLLKLLASHGITPDTLSSWALIPALLLTGCYVGYFGAAAGIVMLVLLSLMYDANLQNSNAAKNLLGGAGNLAGAAVFVLAGQVSWDAALVIAAGATIGGLVGAPFARQLPTVWLRGLVIATGLVAAAVSLVRAYG